MGIQGQPASDLETSNELPDAEPGQSAEISGLLGKASETAHHVELASQLQELK